MVKKYIDADKLKRFEEMLADIIVSSQGLCTYEACKDRAKIEAPVLIGSLQQEQPKLYKDESLGSPDYERGFKHGRDYQTEVTRKYTNKDKVIAYLVDKGYPVSTNGEIPTYQEIFDMINNAIKHANKQEQPEVDLAEEIVSFFNKHPLYRMTDWPIMKNVAFHFYELGRLNARKEE